MIWDFDNSCAGIARTERGNQAAGTRRSPRRGDHTTKKAASCHADCSSASLRRDAASFWKHLFAFGEMLLRFGEMQLRFGEMQLCLEEAVSFMGKPLFLSCEKPIRLLSSFLFQPCALRRRKMRREEITYEKINAGKGFTSASARKLFMVRVGLFVGYET
ncbi:MAG: hypothetical protein K2I16_02555 [Muribaculaceae bacterium]|nr:hypothetical protein [Muribaculaceae bacterium]